MALTSASVNSSSSAAQVLTLQNGFLATSASGISNTYAIDPNYRIGYAQTWNFTLQSDLKYGLFGTVGYMGTKGTRLDQQFLPNSVAPGLPASIYPSGFIYETSGGNSIYGAGRLHGFTGDGSTGLGYGGGGGGATSPASVAARTGGAGANGVVIVTEYYY